MWSIQLKIWFMIALAIHQNQVHADLSPIQSTIMQPTSQAQGEPEIENFKCGEKEAMIIWKPYGNSETIEHYTIEYSTSFEPNVWSVFADKISETSHVVSLSPGATFSIRVIQKYKNGKSSPPSESTELCTTKPDVPYINPTNVQVTSASKGTLLVSWIPMPQLEHNGRGFFYLIYRRKEGNKIWRKEVTIADWKLDQYIIKMLSDVNYEIKVVAGNELGESKAEPQVIVGNPGENHSTTQPPIQSTTPSLEYTTVMITTPLTEATTQSSSGISTTYEPTYPPTYEPTYRPTYRPTYVPPSSTYGPTYEPTYRPTYRPTYVPPSSTYSPTYEPTYRPTHRPTYVPPSSTYRPAYKPTNRPTTNPPNVTTIQPPPIYEPEINYFKCHDNQADISWIPRGNTENIVYYTIEHSTSFKPYVWSIFVDKTDANFHVISLSPGTTYTFRVIATDKNGKFSQSSETEMCSTKPDAPYTNPTNVYVKSASSNYLLVSWKPMAQSIHNGPGFFYRIYYRQAGLGWIRPWNQETVTDWKQDKYLLKYSSSLKWEIKVVAVNKVGESKVKPIVITI